MNASSDRVLTNARVILAATLIFAAQGVGAATDDELIVTANKAPQAPLTLIGNTARLSEDQIRFTNHQHIHELAHRIAGTWISRGSGQEHLTAIRSPVLTGAGACGAFLVLENGVATRPTGFCNVNQLFEVPSELAASTEVIRGPANALYGSNGLHGTINIVLPEPGANRGLEADLNLGPDQYGRGALRWAGAAGAAELATGIVIDEYDGFRDDSGYAQQKGFVAVEQRWPASTLRINFSGSNLNQETAGFVVGENAYRDELLRTTNPNPEAFRDANSQRIVVTWTPDEQHRWYGTDVRAWMRRSDMEFLQHFLPGQPLEENGKLSAGLSVTQRTTSVFSSQLTSGFDLEIADGFLEEFQAGPVTNGSAFLIETRPAGPHYDYDVRSAMLAAFGQWTLSIREKWDAQFGLRAEYLYYDYDNKLPDGNNRIDGTPCGFGGCRFNRPTDRTDDFINIAPNAGLLYRLNDTASLFATLSRGFRAPQVTELYRLQNDQTVADLDSEVIDSIEFGARQYTDNVRAEAILFAMRKDNYIFRDADGFNISDGESRHLGVEVTVDVALGTRFYAGLAGSWSEQTYRFDRNVAAGETIISGDEVDTAPGTLGSARLGYADDRLETELEWVHQGAYYLDAANTGKYTGHNLLNIRGLWHLDRRWSLGLRINNVLDARYADRADFAFGSFRYFPGREREWFLQIRYHSRSASEE